ncbi:MAG: amidase [Acidobacteriota bacterium]
MMSEEKGGWNRRDFILAGSVAGGLAAMSACSVNQPGQSGESVSGAPFELEEMDIQALQQAMEGGRLSSEEITRLYLDRIEALDRQGPTLRCIIETNPQALEIARALDQERREKGSRGPLHGIPVVLKDNIDTSDRMTTTAGSYALEGSIPAQDAFMAGRLRQAGAVLLAKANLSEWANFRSERSSSGWSGRGGQCRNPYYLDRNPCGSSSGSAVATSANLCAAAIGTETNGSIVCPSNANGVVGLKPTVGLVSRSGIIPISHSQDTAGPITRTVADAALMLGLLTGVDPSDPATAESAAHVLPDYRTALDPKALAGARIGVVRKFFGFDDRVDALMEQALETMKRLGAEIVDPAEIPTFGKYGRPSYEVLLYEFKADLNAYLARLGDRAPVKSLEEVIRFNEEHAETEMPFFGQEIFIESQAKGPLTDPEYLSALESARSLAGPQGIDKIMDEQRLDALVAPTGGPAWTTDLVNGDHFSGGSSSPAAIAGYPNISLPAGFIHGLPVGISFFGRAWSEARLIGLAYAFEQESHVRRPPRMLASIEGA